MMRPDVHLHLRLARRLRMRSLRETEERAHEGERGLRDERLCEVLERIECSGDDEIRTVHAVDCGGERVHHPAIHARRIQRREVQAEVRLVPDLKGMYSRLTVPPVI